MREIKFRYVFRRKQDGHIWMLIVPIEAIEDGSGQLATMLSNELWELISRDQFTGLKDKGGVEIYEGDICKFAMTPKSTDPIIAQVSFFELGGWWSFGGNRLSDFLSNYWFEVIGNIHHNKDLLK